MENLKIRERSMERLRELAIIDARRRLKIIESKLGEWNIVDVERDLKGEKFIEKRLVFDLKDNFTNLTLNDYAIIRELKYIIWRFSLDITEVNGG